MNGENEVKGLLPTDHPLSPPSTSPSLWKRCKNVVDLSEKHRIRILAFLGVGLYCLDFGSDIYVAQELIRECHYVFGALAIAFILLPNIFLGPRRKIKVILGAQYYTLYYGIKSVMYGTSDTMTEFKSLKSLEVSWESLPQLYLTLYILFTKGWQDTLPTGKVFSALTSYISVLLGFSQKKILNIDSEAPLTLVLWQIMASLIALTLHILAFTVCFLSFKYYAIVVLLLYFLGFSIIFYHLWMKHYGESQNIEVEQSYKLLQGCWSNFKLFYSANGQRIKDKKSFLSILRSHHYSLSSLFKIESRRYAHVVGVIFYTALMGVIHVLSSVEYVHLLPHLQESNQTQCDQCQSSCPQYAGPNEIRTLTYIVWGLTVIYCIEGIVEYVALQWTPFGVVIKYRGETERKEFEKQERRRKEVED